MLTVTEKANEVIRTITERPDYPDTAGLRIAASQEQPPRLSAMPAESPETGDEVIENDGARVFLQVEAAMMLDDQVLDAAVDDQGQVQFVVAGQQPPG